VMVSIATTAPTKVMGRKALDFMSLSPELATYLQSTNMKRYLRAYKSAICGGFFPLAPYR